MLDREVGLVPAIGASLKLSRECPAAVALWGLIVAAGLVFGALTLFVGLAVVDAGARSFDMAALSPGRRARGSNRAASRTETSRRPPTAESEAVERQRNAEAQANDGWRSRFR